jgi:hypothetical protein
MDGKAAPPDQSAVEKKVGEWVVPRAVDGANVKIPKHDIRVRIRRREGLPEQRTVRKAK